MNTSPIVQAPLSRRPYTPPVVTTFGSIAKLTQGGGGTRADGIHMNHK